MRFSFAVLLSVAVCLCGSVFADDPDDEPAEKDGIDFAHDVVPILVKRCGECHLGGKQQGGFSLATRASVLKGGESGPAVVSGKSAESELVSRITTDDEFLRMPPEGPRLSQQEVAVLAHWIDAGLPWDDDVTFGDPTYTPPLRHRVVEIPGSHAGRKHPIDRFLERYFAENGLSFPEPVDDATYLRRVHFDLLGLLPPVELSEEFLADTDPEKRAKLVDHLLADDEAYAGHWLTFWNDLLRNDYSGTGFITGGRKQVTGWLYTSLRENKPYRQFVGELVSPTPESAGFLNGITWRGVATVAQRTEMQFAQSLSQSFLGINLKCASCHDSFISRWKLSEAYGLAAVAANGPLPIHRCDKPTGETATPGWLFPELGELDPAADRESRLRQLAELVTHPENGRLDRTLVNRLWHQLLGRGLVHPVDAMDTAPVDADLLDWLAYTFRESEGDVKGMLRLIATSQIYQARVQASDAGEVKFLGPRTKRLTAEQYVDAIWSVTQTTPGKIDAALSASDAESKPRVRASLKKADLLMRALGRPNRDQIVTSRPETLTTLEAITLFNHPQFASLLQTGGQKLAAREWDSAAAFTKWLYRSMLVREPTATELDAAVGLLGEAPTATSIEDLLWVVLVLPEFQLVR